MQEKCFDISILYLDASPLNFLSLHLKLGIWCKEYCKCKSRLLVIYLCFSVIAPVSPILFFTYELKILNYAPVLFLLLLFAINTIIDLFLILIQFEQLDSYARLCSSKVFHIVLMDYSILLFGNNIYSFEFI